MGKNADNDGWTVVPESKGATFKKKKADEAAAAKVKKQEEEEAKKGFNCLVKSEKKASEPVPESPKKTQKTEEEKAKDRKERKKEAAKKAAVAAAATKAPSPKAEVILADKTKKIPAKVLEGIKELPEKYTGRVKDQYHTAVAFMNDYLTPECTCAANYKSLPIEKRWTYPLCDAQGFEPLLVSIIKGSSDQNMWTAMLKDLLIQGFGRECNRPDDGKHYIGSKIAVQVLLKEFPSCFNKTVETIFAHEDNEMVGAAAINFTWVLANLADSSAMEGVQAWARVYYPRLVANEGRNGGNIVEAGFAVADVLAGLEATDEEKKRWRIANKDKDPLTYEQLTTPLKLIAPKKNKMVKLYKALLPSNSALFTPQSPRLYFAKLAGLLEKANEVNKPLILDLLVECIVYDPSSHGPLYCWTNNILFMVKESAQILEHISKNQKALSTRLNGKEMEKFFERLVQKCKEVQDGTLVPDAKKAKNCKHTPADVNNVLHWVGKVSSLAKAVPLDAPQTKKTQQTIKEVRREALEASQKKGFCSMLFSFILFVAIMVLGYNLMLPFLPKETVAAINVQTAKLHTAAQPLLAKLEPHYAVVQPHIQKAQASILDGIATLKKSMQ
eukprot:TRINITY_DN13476_c0_g5_i1.p2 TRINITY_DN13476_c0_g5~~TRINITY_DN13476_c0_g5_i1.p2  ORF type:complete len:613 (+),score=304.57 TRINITY_DN13476_c0_g5_i1:58-1896(+)